MPTSTAPGKLQRVRHTIASRGLVRGLLDVASVLTSYDPERDSDFDERFGTDTSGAVAVTDLGIEQQRLRDNAIRYLPSPMGVTRWMLNNVGVDFPNTSFIDVGCGKGRVLLVATEFPFRRVVGVEISPQLCAIARRNAAIYRPTSRKCADVEVLAMSALDVEFPPTDLLLHLYHPFDVAITRDLLQRLGASLRAQPRTVVIAYLAYESALDAIQSVFAEFDWLRLARREGSVLGQYDWLIYRNVAG